MADRFLVGTGSRTWDGSNTAIWSATSGGATGASAPTSADNVFIDANSGTATITVASTAACNNLTVTWTAAKTNILSLAANFSPAGTLTITGNSAINRVLVQSSVVGTPRTITAAAVSLTNVDFMDIAGAGAATWSGTSIGDAQGNSGITFTTPTTRYWVATSGGSWSATTSWSASSGGASGASVPLCHDAVVIDANSITSSGRTITVDMPRLGKDISFAGVLNSPATQINPVGTVTIYGSLTLGSGMGAPAFISGAVTFASRSAAIITTNGIQLQSTSSTTFAGPGGTFDLADDLTTAGSSTGSGMVWQAGTFNSNGYTLRSAGKYLPFGGTVNLGASLIETSASGVVWSYTSGVVNAGTSTLKFTDASATAKTFAGGGKTYNNVWFNNAGSGTFDITGSNTFNQFKVDAGRSVRFTAATTTTAADFDIGAGCTIGSITAASHTLAKTGGGSVLVSGATISRSTATPASTFYAEASTNGGNNSGWTFGPRIVATAGSITITGQQATLGYQRVLGVTPGAITITGGTARFVWVNVLKGTYRFTVPPRTQRFTVPARTIRFRSGGGT